LVNLRFRLAKLNAKKSIQVEVTDINTNIITIYDSIRKAALALKVDKSALLINEKTNKVFRGKYLINIKR
jgi:Fe-S cluster biosynthesis and repair protein YggX